MCLYLYTHVCVYVHSFDIDNDNNDAAGDNALLLSVRLAQKALRRYANANGTVCMGPIYYHYYNHFDMFT